MSNEDYKKGYRDGYIGMLEWFSVKLKYLLKVKTFDDIVPAIQKLQERVEELKISIEN